MNLYQRGNDKMHCPNCEKEVPEGKRFCGYCGHPLVSEEGPRPLSREPFDDDAPTMLYASEQTGESPPELEEQEAEVSDPVKAQKTPLPEAAQPLSLKEATDGGGFDSPPRAKAGVREILKSFPWESWIILIAGWFIAGWLGSLIIINLGVF